MGNSCIPAFNAPSKGFGFKQRFCSKRLVTSDALPNITIPDNRIPDNEIVDNEIVDNETLNSEEVSEDILKDVYPDTEIPYEDDKKHELIFKAAVLIGFILYTFLMYHTVNTADL